MCTERVHVDTFFLGALGSPQKRWVGGPNLHPTRVVSLTNIKWSVWPHWISGSVRQRVICMKQFDRIGHSFPVVAKVAAAAMTEVTAVWLYSKKLFVEVELAAVSTKQMSHLPLQEATNVIRHRSLGRNHRSHVGDQVTPTMHRYSIVRSIDLLVTDARSGVDMDANFQRKVASVKNRTDRTPKRNTTRIFCRIQFEDVLRDNIAIGGFTFGQSRTKASRSTSLVR
jgi:hypothetical protein